MSVFLAAASQQEIRRSCGEDPGLICRTVLDLTGSERLAEASGWVVDAPLKILLIVAVALVVTRVLRRAIKRGLRRLHSGTLRERMGAVRRGAPAALVETEETSLRAEQRIDALTSVLRSAVTFAVWLIVGLLVLGELGINLGPLLAGAGILGVALGFGSQSLVRDFLSGLFILVEDQFGVGDIVDLDGQTTGVVEGVSLRTTRLRSVDGTVWHVPNGEIRRVGNMSQHWSRSLLDIEVAYSTDLESAKAVIKEVADALWREDSAVVDEPELWGVEQLGANGIALRLVVKTTPAEQWRISRQLRERIKGAFDEAGIEIPFPQQVVWHRGHAPEPAAGPPEASGGAGDGGSRAGERRAG